MATARKLETTFVYERETKGTFRYNEEGPKEVQIIGALYVKKAALGGLPPQKLIVTVEEA